MAHHNENSPHTLLVASLPQNRAHRFEITPTEPERRLLATELGVSSLRKLRFSGEVKGAGKRDFVLHAKLGATVIQPCVQTLDPVTTRLDTEVERRFIANWHDVEESGAETEMPEDVTSEELGTTISLWDAMIEALALAIPDYPRAPDAPPLGDTNITEPGKQAMRDEDTKPFAGLAALKKQLGAQEEDS
ncbi:DUF177 domain-containing protein [Marinovum sp. 2_MG-2023]|uniref:YceD family protein n=1 Tax=unclassified Marinovum TaxID=2647166 RepID=UPI0026E475EA|nr:MULTISPECIES: DUF177 domain-containing protein [unclassified Marinovum]MDO6731598.1 DUF177 domain-containing protein [Marinovum sp. 2_MG-2023]MDO6778276.1 DUF177 domain-containing protein [Marinovum sp. 1_MG-2023]